MVTALNSVNKWYKVNLLSINVDKTHYIQFKTKIKPTVGINIACNDNLITTVPKIKFWDLYIYMIHETGVIILNISFQNEALHVT
jgi:hypothetical protein